MERTKKFKEIIESIGKGYSEEKHDKLRIINGKIYGGIMATEIEGKYFLIDGTHRISAMIVNDIFEVPLLICE